MFIEVLRVYRHAVRHVLRERVNLWLTYHTYYKAPDLLGPNVSKRTNIPYIIFQGIYSTKRRRKLKTWPGFGLNQVALKNARHIFTNRREDWDNLKRFVPQDRISYVRPGIHTDDFYFDADARKQIRQSLGVEAEVVILAVAMFRSDVKTKGLTFLIRSCGRLIKEGLRFKLVIAGDGKERRYLEQLAKKHLGASVHFVGRIKRADMFRYYSASDLFAFPGIRESLGMVYLESQSCGLPVIAFRNGGIPEVVKDNTTGFLTPVHEQDAFDSAIRRLVTDSDLRHLMGKAASAYVRSWHQLNSNYDAVETTLLTIAGANKHAG